MSPVPLFALVPFYVIFHNLWRGADDRLLRKQLDQKWRTLDQFEASLKKLETSKMQWRAKMAIKDGELEAAKVSLGFFSPFILVICMRDQDMT